ncbi:MAG: hypothetical protein EAZ55_08355 [Cytophagales bacterium]|nr:MAG: hypothetical protein EAZ55_08355 [Cytophagales bacterium]
MLKKYRKIFIYLFISLNIILLLLALLPWVFKGAIFDQLDAALQQSQTKITVQYNREQSYLSFYEQWGNLSFHLAALQIVGNEAPFVGEDIFKAEKITLRFSLFSLVFGHLKLHSVDLQQPILNLRNTIEGKQNWQLLASPPADTTQKKEIQDPATKSTTTETDWLPAWVQVSEGQIFFKDELTELAFQVEKWGVKLEKQGNLWRFHLDIPQINSQIGKNKWLEKHQIRLNTQIREIAPLQWQLEEDNHLNINTLQLILKGKVALVEGNWQTDLHFEQADASVKNLVSISPFFYNTHFAKLQCEGKASFKGDLKGTFDAEKRLTPQFTGQMRIENGTLQYTDKKGKVENWQLDLVWSPAEIKLNHLQFKTPQSSFDWRFRIAQKTDFEIDASVNLAEIQQIAHLPNIEVLSGTLQTKTKGNIDQYKFSAIGDLKLEKAQAKIQSPNLVLKAIDFQFSFADSLLQAKQFNAQFFNGTLEAQGSVVVDLREPTYQLQMRCNDWQIAEILDFTKSLSQREIQDNLTGKIGIEAKITQKQNLDAQIIVKDLRISPPSKILDNVKKLIKFIPPEGISISDFSIPFQARKDTLLLQSFSLIADQNIKIDVENSHILQGFLDVVLSVELPLLKLNLMAATALAATSQYSLENAKTIFVKMQLEGTALAPRFHLLSVGKNEERKTLRQRIKKNTFAGKSP